MVEPIEVKTATKVIVVVKMFDIDDPEPDRHRISSKLHEYPILYAGTKYRWSVTKYDMDYGNCSYAYVYVKQAFIGDESIPAGQIFYVTKKTEYEITHHQKFIDDCKRL